MNHNCRVFVPPFHVLSGYLYVLLNFGGSFHCLNFVKFREDYRAFHKLLGNFVATSRISSNFMYSEQFLQLSSNSEISDRDRGGGGAGRAIALPLLLLGFIS